MRWLLRLFVSETDRRAIENDLSELYELRRRQEGAAAAERWLRRQRLLYPVHVVLESVRATIGGALGAIAHLGRDIPYSARSLARTPALTATIVLTVGIGLGATTAMLGVVRAVLIDPLPYAASDELFWIYTDNPPYRFSLSVVDYRALESDHPAFSAVTAYHPSTVTITDNGIAERIRAKVVARSYFGTLGQSALLGRLFDPSDEARGERIVVLTAAYWDSSALRAASWSG
jgi:MacB-like periplasmic core domain